MGEKKRKGRRAYLSDFRPDDAGGYLYAGAVHEFQGSAAERKRTLIVLWALTAVMAAGAVIAGCVPAAGMQNTAYVLLPYAGGVLSAASVVWLMCRLTGGGDPLRDYVYKATVEQFEPRGVLTLVFSAASLLGSAVFLLRNGAGDQMAGTIAFWVCELAVLGCAAGWLRYTKKQRWS